MTTIITLEGNTNQQASRTGGQVARLKRSTNIVGYGMPRYDAAHSASKLLAEERRHLGYTEGANNHTEFGAEYGMDHEPWCDIFQSVCGLHAFGSYEVVGKFAYTPSHVDWFKKIGRWSSTHAQVGALAFIYIPELGRVGHVVLVESVVASHVVTHKPVHHHTRTLRTGSHGGDVVDLQNMLNAHGASPRLHPDGAFGPKTRQEVIDYQRKHHLQVDGVVGPQTWGSLEKS